MGEPLAGVLRNERPRGDVRYRLDAGMLDGEYIAPRVTNVSGVALRFAVEQQDGAHLCDCDVPATASAEPMGYYRFAPRTVMRLQDRKDREVRYDLRDPIREPVSGLVTILVAPEHLPAEVKPVPIEKRPAQRLAARTAPRHDLPGVEAAPPLEARPIPVSEAPQPAPEPIAEAAPAPTPKRTASRRASNPVGGFLPVR